MNRDQAFEALELEATASTAEIRRRYQELYSDLQLRLTDAPTAAVRQAYEGQLQDLRRACQLLAGGVPEEEDPDLPSLEPVGEGVLQSAPSPTPGLRPQSLPQKKGEGRAGKVVAGIGVVALLLVAGFMFRAGARVEVPPAQAEIAPATVTTASPPPAPQPPPRTEEVRAHARHALHSFDLAHDFDLEHEYDTVDRREVAPQVSHISEQVIAHPGGDDEAYTTTLHEFDLVHDPPSSEADGLLHTQGCQESRSACTHIVDRCSHGASRRCLQCGYGPWALHSYDVTRYCPHAQPCQHRRDCRHAQNHTRHIPCVHLTTQQREIQGTRVVERTERVSCTHREACRHRIPCSHRINS